MRIKYIFSSRHTRTIDPHNRHRESFPHIVRGMIRTCDLVLEVIDARFLKDTRNMELEKYIAEEGKKVIYVLNKIDLVDVSELKEKVEEFELKPYVFISCSARRGIKDLRDRIKIEAKRLKQERKTRVGIVGYPNTGKSSLLNILVGKRFAITGAEAGVTRGVQMVKLTKDILILDTPGVIPDKEVRGKDANMRKKHAIASIKRYDSVKDPDFVVLGVMKQNPGLLEKYYDINALGDVEVLLDELGKKKNLVKRGNIIDRDRVARLVLKEWQDGKIRKN